MVFAGGLLGKETLEGPEITLACWFFSDGRSSWKIGSIGVRNLQDEDEGGGW